MDIMEYESSEEEHQSNSSTPHSSTQPPRTRGRTTLAWLIGKPTGSPKEQIEWDDVWDLEETRKDDVMKLSTSVFRSKKAHWKKKHYRAYTTDDVHLENGLDDLCDEEWVDLVHYWSDPVQKAITERNTENRSKQKVEHTSCRKSFARRRAELVSKAGQWEPPSLGEFFMKTHISKRTNDTLDNASREYIERMQQEAGTDENGDRRPITDEIYKKVIPPERYGRVRLWGPLVTQTTVYGSSTSSSASSSTRMEGL
ncbi:hypothetical protein BVC80_1307g17 [Macleaya cordata]|uniref:Transposase n=1 Tax=Macleaya cordata TaxID=56857 RepID=A0A200R3B9_MACCD|nr:hypothetical protein BVC80_1307g17 [Macleaya cordata]